MLNAVQATLGDPARLAALDRVRMLDTPAEETFDRVARLAVRTLDAKAGLVTFIDAERQFYKSAVLAGEERSAHREVPLELGYCPYTIAARAPVRIEDARNDPSLADNLAVTQVGMVAYLGAPLIDEHGHALGTVCVLDDRPRAWTDADVDTMVALADAVMSEVLLRVASRENTDLGQLARTKADDERWRTTQLCSLAQASLLIYAAPTVDDALSVITEQAREVIGTRRAAAVVAPDGDWTRSSWLVSTSSGVTTRLGRSSPEQWRRYSLVREQNRPLRSSDADRSTGAGRPPGERNGADGPYDWLMVPLVARDGGNLGVLEVSDRGDGEFTISDEFILRHLAQLFTVAVENTYLQAEQVELADAFQRSLLPPALPAIPGLEVATHYRPARRARVAGDFYDVFPLSHQAWGVAVGDVRGKGPGPATIAATARHLLRAAAATRTDPASVLAQLNRSLLVTGDDDPEQFCTLVYAAVHTPPDGIGSCTLETANGGHPLPRVLRRDGSVEEAAAQGNLLGAFEDVEFEARTVHLAAGDAAIFFTDGLTEATVDGHLLGAEGVVRRLPSLADRSAQQIADALADIVAAPGAQQRDDLAILVLRRTA